MPITRGAPGHCAPCLLDAASGGRVHFFEKSLDMCLDLWQDVFMQITYQDQRKNQSTKMTMDMDQLHVLAERAGVTEGTEVRVRVRTMTNGQPYGYTRKQKWGYRVVLHVNYNKPELSEGAKYVLNNTLFHELRHVGQWCEGQTLSSDYHGPHETEARLYGHEMKNDFEGWAIG